MLEQTDPFLVQSPYFFLTEFPKQSWYSIFFKAAYCTKLFQIDLIMVLSNLVQLYTLIDSSYYRFIETLKGDLGYTLEKSKYIKNFGSGLSFSY